jgi:hypothetical protein
MMRSSPPLPADFPLYCALKAQVLSFAMQKRSYHSRRVTDEPDEYQLFRIFVKSTW